MEIIFKPIGFIRAQVKNVPRHWTLSDEEGMLVLNEKFIPGIKDITRGQHIVVIFHFHKSRDFSDYFLVQKPPHKKERCGVFSTCSPIRPNAIGMSVLEVLKIDRNIIYFRGLDMIDGTPVLDIKPLVGTRVDRNST